MKNKTKLKKVTYKFSKTKTGKIAELLQRNKKNIEFGAVGNLYKIKLLAYGPVGVLAIHEPKLKSEGNCTIGEFSSAKCHNNISAFNCSIIESKDVLKAAERGVGVNFVKWFNKENNNFE